MIFAQSVLVFGCTSMSAHASCPTALVGKYHAGDNDKQGQRVSGMVAGVGVCVCVFVRVCVRACVCLLCACVCLCVWLLVVVWCSAADMLASRALSQPLLIHVLSRRPDDTRSWWITGTEDSLYFYVLYKSSIGGQVRLQKMAGDLQD